MNDCIVSDEMSLMIAVVGPEGEVKTIEFTIEETGLLARAFLDRFNKNEGVRG